MARLTFVSDDLQRRFADDGAVALTLFTRDRAAELREEVLRLHTGERVGWHSSNESTDHEYRARVHDAFADVFTDALADVLDDYRLFNTSLLVKWPGQDGVMGTHQDWTFVDEDRFRSVTVWCPLVDVEQHNGALELLPGSQRVLTHVRCSPSLPETYQDPLAGLGEDDLDAWPLPAGTGIALDHAVAHRSPPNWSDAPRIAIAGAFAPSEAVLQHHYRDPSGRIWAFDIPDSAWFRTLDIGQRPHGVPCQGERPFAPQDLSAPELLARCRRTDDRSADGSDTARSSSSSSSWRSRFAGLWRSRRAPSPPRVEVPDTNAPRARTFKANALEGQFREHGYVVVDLLDPAACADLRSAYDDLEHGEQWNGEFAKGFHTTMYDDRVEYRRQVFSLIDGALSSALEPLLEDHRICLANFTVKLPGGEPVPGHLDWSFVDETRASSATVWCALEDVAEEEGALTVLHGSHRNVDFIRPVNVRDYDRHTSVASGDLLEVPVRAGQAVIMDNRMVHGSLPNRSGRTRVAASAVVAPRVAPLHHYWMDDDGELVRFVIDPDFFIDYEIGKDPTRSAGVISRSVLRGVEFA